MMEAVLFDFGGTLDADGIHWSPRFHAAYRAAGGALDFPAFDRLFQESDGQLARLPGIGSLGFRETVEAQVGVLLELLPDAGHVDARRMAERFHAATVATVERNRPVLTRLARCYRLAVVSNFTGNLQPCLRELGLSGLFHVAADSAVVGVEKPDARIFLDTLAALGATPDRTWMVGDNVETDIRPAARLGMKTCWVAPPDREPPAGCVPEARIDRLPDIERVLV